MGQPAAAVPHDRDDSPREDHVVQLSGLDWADYERLLAARGEHSAPRLCFDQGELQVMSPGPDHERVKSFLGCWIEVWAEERGVDLTPLGSWTLKDPRLGRGAEPDECYVLGVEPKDVADLVIEVVWTAGGMNMLPLYAALGVPEVWVWRKGALRVHVREPDGTMLEVGASRVLAGIDRQQLLGFLDHPTATAAQRGYRRALREPR